MRTMVLAFSREVLALATCIGLDPVVVLMLLMLLIASLSRTKSIVLLGPSSCCPIGSPSFGGVSGITVPESGMAVVCGGVAWNVGVLRG